MDNKSLRFLSALYLDYLQAMNYSPRTVSQRESSLRWFADWSEERGLSRAHEITKPILERYRRHLHHSRDRSGKPLSARNQVARLIPLRCFFKWATKQNYLLYNPASELELPRVERRLPKDTLTPQEVEAVLAQPDIATGEGLRDRALLEVLYSTGIRRQELIQLQIADLSVSRGVLAVRQGKGKKDRFVPISERAIGWVQTYLDEIRPSFLVDPDRQEIFIDTNGLPLASDRLSRLVKKYIEQADIGKTGSCHLFRHTVATLRPLLSQVVSVMGSAKSAKPTPATTCLSSPLLAGLPRLVEKRKPPRPKTPARRISPHRGRGEVRKRCSVQVSW